jgi:hypothetical protein
MLWVSDMTAEPVPQVVSRNIRRPIVACLLAVAGVFGLDALLFRTGLYTSILEPDSTAGLFEMILHREQKAQLRHGGNMVETLGDSRFAYYPRAANQLTGETGYVFRHAGVAGTDIRAWNYMLRDLDPTRRRYRAIVLGVDDYDDEDGAYDIGDDLATLHYVIGRLRLGDVFDLARSFENRTAEWQTIRGGLLKGIVYQTDILAFLTHPLKRLAYVRQCDEGYEGWTYDYVDSSKNLAGFEVNWATMTATFPPGADETFRNQVTTWVLYQARPQTGHKAAFRRKWFGELLDQYRGSPTRILFVRLPRGPVPRPAGLVAKKSSSIRELSARPGVTLVDEHAFDSLEKPELFKDAFHLNDGGCSRFSAMLAREVAKTLGPAAVHEARR